MTDTVVTAVGNGWLLVEHGAWQISIGPDDVIRLPLHVSADEVPDLVAAVTAAAEHANTDARLNITEQAASTPVTAVAPEQPQQIPLPHTVPLRGSIGRRGNHNTQQARKP